MQKCPDYDLCSQVLDGDSSVSKSSHQSDSNSSDRNDSSIAKTY